MIGATKSKANSSDLYQRLQQLMPVPEAKSKSTQKVENSTESDSLPSATPTAESVATTNSSSSNTAPTPNRATPPQESAVLPGTYKPLPEELILEWIAPSRPFRKPNRRFFTTITIIGVLIGLILFFANQILPVAVVFAVVFLTYVLFSIPPGDVRYRLTTYGVRIEDKLYYWEELGRFWFTQQYKIDLLHIEVSRFPNTIHLLMGEIPVEAMQEILSEVLLHERPPLSPVEKAAKWLQDKVPLDLEN